MKVGLINWHSIDGEDDLFCEVVKFMEKCATYLRSCPVFYREFQTKCISWVYLRCRNRSDWLGSITPYLTSIGTDQCQISAATY